jgi:hypothetical protein
MGRDVVFWRLLGLGMLIGRVGMALIGGMGGSRFGRMRVMPWDGWMCVCGLSDEGPGSQSNANHEQLPDHVIVFGREPAGL